MSILLTAHDCYVFANAWQDAAIGKNATITAADTTSLTSVGEAILQTGFENTINSLYLLIGNIWTASRKYSGRGKIVQARDSGVYSHRFLKTSVYSRRAIPSGYWNTDLMPENFKPGATNAQELDPVTGNPVSTKSMWEQSPAITTTFSYGGSKVIDFEAPTMYLDKIEQAFRNESQFRDWVNGVVEQFNNDLEQYRENFNREQLCSAMAQDLNMESVRPESVVHCVTEFNAEFNPSGTPYTADELKTVYAKDFYSWLAAKIDIVADRMKERSVLFHWDPVKTVNGVDYDILRFTPAKNLKAAMYAPAFTKMEKYVLPEVFNSSLLKIGTENFEKFSYWQNINVPDQIYIKPAVNDTDPTSATYMQQIDGTAVNAEVLLYLWDEDRLLTDIQLNRSLTSPVEARKGFFNTFHHWAFNHISDATENSCLFVMD